MSNQNKWWLLVVILLLMAIVTSSLIIWFKFPRNQPLEIIITPEPKLQGEIYVGGAVSNPGFYPLRAEDTLADLIRAAGGTSADANFSRLKLYIPTAGEEEPPQKININRAEAWLLQALPQIGESRAKAIIAYRQKNGRFNHINELSKVEGIGTATLEKIKHLITVAD